MLVKIMTETPDPASVEAPSRAAFWRDRPALVTGGTGLVGGWLVKRLVEFGADVVCLVRDWTPHSELVRTGLVERVKTVRGELSDQAMLERALSEYDIATVFHLAAQTIVGIANQNPVATLEANVRGTWALLEACRRSSRVEQIVIASSDKAYGDQPVLPYEESTPLQGRHPYDVSKSCADLIAQMYAHTYQTPVAITRCGNFYGGGDLNWNRVVPGTIRSILRGEAPIIRSDGRYVRDYLYVEDGAAAYILLAELMQDRPDLRGRAFNLSTGTPLTVIEIVETIQRLMKFGRPPVILNQASNEIREQYLDATRAREELSWSPQFSLDEGLRRTIQWYESLLGGRAAASAEPVSAPQE